MTTVASQQLVLAAKLVIGALVQPALFTLLLFGPAGTFAWWRAWLLIVVITFATAGSLVVLAQTDPELLAERMKPPLQARQPFADKVVVMAFLTAFVGAIVFIPVDVFRLHLLPPPPAWLSTAGLALFLAGWWLITRAMRTNTFAAPVVKHQAERHQYVVDHGPYAVVRHPMYAGAALLFIGLPLWLESSAGVLAALVPIATLALRAAIEERFLRRALPGYDAYTGRVRFRLIPGVW
jgi:protein-S-isoprenylcysteine O-methyltransferase Ste14